MTNNLPLVASLLVPTSVEKRFNKAIIDNKENQGRLANQLRR